MNNIRTTWFDQKMPLADPCQHPWGVSFQCYSQVLSLLLYVHVRSSCNAVIGSQYKINKTAEPNRILVQNLPIDSDLKKE